jgi:Fe-S-cluster containining protein
VGEANQGKGENQIETNTLYHHFEISFPKSWAVNLPFLCVKCGNCCTVHAFDTAGYILAGNPSKEQEKAVNQKLKVFVDKHKNNPRFWELKCPFLLKDNTCEIYPYRPKGCSLFPRTDTGMSTQEGLCESLDRFKRLRKELVRGSRDAYRSYSFFTEENGIKPVRMTKRRFEACIRRLVRAGMTTDELSLFKSLNVL